MSFGLYIGSIISGDQKEHIFLQKRHPIKSFSLSPLNLSKAN